MLEPTIQCPQVSIVFRWGWPPGVNVFSKAKTAATHLSNLTLRHDHKIRVMNPGARVPVMERLIVPYDDELDICKKATEGMDLGGFEFRSRPRLGSYGEEQEYIERTLVENPGYILLCDHGLIHFLDMADVPGEAELPQNTVTAKVAFALRIAKELGVRIMSVRHQNNLGAPVKGMPPQSRASKTGYVNVKAGVRDMQQMFFISHDAQSHWRPWNYLEDRARALDERKVSGPESVALYEGMSVRFHENKLVKDRYFSQDEWKRNSRILKREYNVKFKKKFPECHG